MRNFAFVVVGAFVLYGCGQNPKAKEIAAGNPSTLTVEEADMAHAAPETAVVANALMTGAAPAAEVVVNTEAGPLVDSAAAVADPVVSGVSDTPDEISIQKALKNLGLYSGEIDGKVGPKTQQAIVEFQTRNGLVADGKVGAKTWAVLKKALENT
jgi:peptidoglycan hydrolase-like protein with peptidoglycan-binding domain